MDITIWVAGCREDAPFQTGGEIRVSNKERMKHNQQLAVSMQKLFHQTFEGHKGRKGEVGGSLPASGSSTKSTDHYVEGNVPKKITDDIDKTWLGDRRSVALGTITSRSKNDVSVMKDGNEVVAIVGYRPERLVFIPPGVPDGKYTYIDGIATKRGGYGREAMQIAIDKARSNGTGLLLHANNAPVGFYQEIGMNQNKKDERSFYWTAKEIKNVNVVKQNQRLFTQTFEGHAGRPGFVGGSVAEKAGAQTVSTIDHRKRVEDVVNRLGFPVDRVKSTEDKGYLFTVGDQQFRAGGEYNPITGEITVFDVDEMSDSNMQGILAHEIQHSNFKEYHDAYQRQFVEINRKAQELGWGRNKEWPIRADGSIRNPADKKKYWAYNIHETYFTFSSDNWKSLESLDGVSEYSTSYWKNAASTGSAYDYDRAVDETLAEIARINIGSNRPGDALPSNIAPLWQDLYKQVKRGK